MTGDLQDRRPAPPWSADTDLRVFAHIEIPRDLITAPAFADLEPAERWAQLRLITASWHEVPAGSIPANPRTLADLAGFGADVGAWLSIEGRVLSAWTSCNDDRLYFEPLTDVIAAAFERRQKTRKGNASRTRRHAIIGLLIDIGVPNVKGLPRATIDAVAEDFYARGGADLRGQGRVDLATMLASERDLLPRGMAGDARMDVTPLGVAGRRTSM